MEPCGKLNKQPIQPRHLDCVRLLSDGNNDCGCCGRKLFSIVKRVFPYTRLCQRGCVSTRLALKLYSTTIHVQTPAHYSKVLLLFPALFTRRIPSRFTLRKQKHLMKYACCICGRLDNRPGAKHVWCAWPREGSYSYTKHKNYG